MLGEHFAFQSSYDETLIVGCETASREAFRVSGDERVHRQFFGRLRRIDLFGSRYIIGR